MKQLIYDVRLKVLWIVPILCMVAGRLTYVFFQAGLKRVDILTLADLSFTVNNQYSLLYYGIAMAVVLLIGWKLVFGKMTRKEIFLSASILVILDLVRFVICVSDNANPLLVALFYRFGTVSEWCHFIYHMFFRLTENVNLGVLLGCFAPYLFVLFGKAKIQTYEAG